MNKSKKLIKDYRKHLRKVEYDTFRVSKSRNVYRSEIMKFSVNAIINYKSHGFKNEVFAIYKEQINIHRRCTLYDIYCEIYINRESLKPLFQVEFYNDPSRLPF